MEKKSAAFDAEKDKLVVEEEAMTDERKKVLLMIRAPRGLPHAGGSGSAEDSLTILMKILAFGRCARTPPDLIYMGGGIRPRRPAKQPG